MENPPHKEMPSRRDALKFGAVGVVATVTKTAVCQTTAAPTDLADLAVLNRTLDHDYSEVERILMARSMGRTRESLRALRQAKLPAEMEPATLFDVRLPGMKLPGGRSGCRLSEGTSPTYSSKIEDLAFASVVDLSRLLKSRTITSTELTKMYLARLRTIGEKLLCVVNITEKLALEQAARADREIGAGKYRGPLHGIPWGAKDLLATKGIPTTWGAKPYENQVFDYDATVVKRLEAAGAVLCAKLSMGELAMGDVWFKGMTLCPWNTKIGSSGSSAGPGAATAAGLVGFTIGTETLGSIVSPSVRNGVTGLRPTFGRVSRNGAMALCWTMDKIGPMCRTVEDCAIVFNAIYGPDQRDRTVVDAPFRWDPRSKLSGLRVGYDKPAFDQIENGDNAEQKKVYSDVLDVLRNLGITLRPIEMPKSTPAYGALAGTIIDCESAAAFAKLTASVDIHQLRQQNEGSWPNTFRIGSTIPAADYIQAMRIRMQLQFEMAKALEDVDLWVTPPFESLVYTNLTGHPTLVTRCGMVRGVPQMVEFTGQLFREDAILRVAHAFEQATDHHKLWPDTGKL